MQRQDGLSPKRSIGFRIIGIGIVTRNAQQHGRHTESQRDVACGAVGIDKIHILRAQLKYWPNPARPQKQRTSGILSTLKILLQFLLQPVKLRIGQTLTVRTAIDQSPEGRAAFSNNALFQ